MSLARLLLTKTLRPTNVMGLAAPSITSVSLQSHSRPFLVPHYGRLKRIEFASHNYRFFSDKTPNDGDTDGEREKLQEPNDRMRNVERVFRDSDDEAFNDIDEEDDVKLESGTKSKGTDKKNRVKASKKTGKKQQNTIGQMKEATPVYSDYDPDYLVEDELPVEDDDPFGVFLEDNEQLAMAPPLYKRDALTGRLTDEIVPELDDETRRILDARPMDKDKLLSERLEHHWQDSGLDSSGDVAELDKSGDKVRRTDMGLNVLGRSTRAQATKELTDDGTLEGRDETRFSQKLTENELTSLRDYMAHMKMTRISKEDIPVQNNSKYVGPTSPPDDSDPNNFDFDDSDPYEFGPNKSHLNSLDPDSNELSTKWLSARARRQMDDILDDNPYAELIPRELSPSLLVNRKKAKLLPTEILHHNNLDLLRSFLTPTGEIKSRVQTRLGARDQRRIARLIKRARCLGLIPFMGQFRTERHGWIHAKDLHENRDWEDELVRRGLVIKRSGGEEKGSK